MIALMKRILNVAGGYKGRIQLAFVFSFLKSLLAKAPIGMAFLVLTAFLDGSADGRLCLTMGAAMAICLVLQVLCQHGLRRILMAQEDHSALQQGEQILYTNVWINSSIC